MACKLFYGCSERISSAVVHENARHIETEEVSRIKDHERHIHHVQHHVQPVKDLEEREEVHHENVSASALDSAPFC